MGRILTWLRHRRIFRRILLHQVLQWHHLLSGIEQARHDIRVLILWDGIFHVLMYIIAGVGFWLLWRARREWASKDADRRLFANALIGFGGWHILDSVLSHWILGIHRIRMDVDKPVVLGPALVCRLWYCSGCPWLDDATRWRQWKRPYQEFTPSASDDCDCSRTTRRSSAIRSNAGSRSFPTWKFGAAGSCCYHGSRRQNDRLR